MLTPQQWKTLLYLKPSDFKNPDGLQYSVVNELDKFISHIGSRPVILSDYRDNDPKEHGQGTAIDTTWPGVEPLTVHDKAMKWPGFTGVGIYVNEQGITSFHFDTRSHTIRPNEPDRWGGIISHPLDSQTGDTVRQTEYVAANTVIEMLKKKEVGLIILLAISGLILYHYTRR